MLFESMQVYESKEVITILCQDLDDIISPEDARTSVQEFRFTGENIQKLYALAEEKGKETWQYKNRFGYPALVDNIGWVYYHGSHLQSWFESDRFKDDCRAYGIEYRWERMNRIWTHPEHPYEEQDFVDHLKACHIELPENYRPSTVNKSGTYWPLAIDLTSKTAEKIIGITPCACYCSSHVIIPYRDLHLFML